MLPIRVRQAPNFFIQTLERSLLLRRAGGAERTFHLCYFSCRSYFRYLYCALHSLAQQAADIEVRVTVFNDEEQPMSTCQAAEIRRLLPGIRIIPWPKSMGWGSAQIGWIWQAYRLVAEDAEDDDVIARIDSDVFFFNDRIFRAVQRSDADMIGDGHYVNFEYCQGGCYFFRASAVRRIADFLDTNPLESLLEEAGIVVEDVAAHHFARLLGLKVWQTWFMMFPDELRNAGGLTLWQRWKFSCAHFVMKNKAAMLEAYDKEVLADSDDLAAYRRALELN